MKFSFSLPLILDGATGSELSKRGMPMKTCTEQWVLEHPDAMIEIQRSYMQAGSQLVYAPTFAANPVALKTHGLGDVDIQDFIMRLVAITKEATEGNCLIAGDMAPTGLQMFPMGDASFADIIAAYEVQAKALEESGVDCFAVETQMSLAEARAAVLAIQKYSDKPILCTFVCGETGKTIYGGDLTAALITMQNMGVAAFGINCCGNLDVVIRVLQEMKPYAKVPLIAKPNAGMPQVVDGDTIYSMTPETLASHIPAFWDAGARIFGGCCGTHAEHIRSIFEALQAMPKTETECFGTKQGCASEKMVFDLADMPSIEEIPTLVLDDDIIASTMEARAEGTEILKVIPKTEEEVETLLENQYAIALPLYLECSDATLRTQLMYGYHGALLCSEEDQN